MFDHISSVSGAVCRIYGFSVFGKREPKGEVSHHLHHKLSVGDTLLAGKPAGDFALDAGESAVTLISSGVGITPMMSMLQKIVHSGSTRPVLFVHGARNTQQQAFSKELSELAGSYSNIEVCVAHSQPSTTELKEKNHDIVGRLSSDLIQTLKPNLAGQFYLCGPVGMIADLTSGLLELGVDERNIHFESFGGVS
ncbi:MAG: hypothetical protein AB8B86_11940 [Pseudomonadales bacterium]